jgi:hypothetical protein
LIRESSTTTFAGEAAGLAFSILPKNRGGCDVGAKSDDAFKCQTPRVVRKAQALLLRPQAMDAALSKAA